MRISRISLKNWHRVKKRTVVLVSMLQEHNGFKVSSKLGLNVSKTSQVDSVYYKLYHKYRVFKILTRLCLGIPLNKNSYIDTSHLISNQFTGFCMIRVFTGRDYLMDFNKLPAENENLSNKIHLSFPL